MAEKQAGFRPQRRTHNHRCSLRILTGKAPSRRQPLYMCFVDFEKAFDKAKPQETVEGDGGHGIRETSRRLHTSAIRKLEIKCPYSWKDKWLVQSQARSETGVHSVPLPFQPDG